MTSQYYKKYELLNQIYVHILKRSCDKLTTLQDAIGSPSYS